MKSTAIFPLVILLGQQHSCVSLTSTSPKGTFWSGIREFGAVGCFVMSCLAGPIASYAETKEWQLMNGDVRLEDPTLLVVGEKKTLSLEKPELIGAGGGGAVFAFQGSKSLIKVSWEGSAKSVERECSTLKAMELNGIEAAERCLGQFEYPSDPQRVMILVEPYVQDAVASVMEVKPSMRPFAVRQIARTLVQMLAANIITIDVQPLISKETGDVIFIDMTEAQVLTPPFSFLDTTLISSFATEMITLIPKPFESLASKTVLEEVKRLEGSGVSLSTEARDILDAFVAQ